MEPVFMVLAQSAAVAASFAIDARQNLHDIDVKKIQKELEINPLADKSQAEILIDNDSKNVQIKGNWTVVPKGYGRYGRDYLMTDTGDNMAKSVSYTPHLPNAQKYSIYIYIPRHEQITKTLTLHVVKSNGRQTITLYPKVNESDWLLVGDFMLEKGMNTTIEVSTEGGDGVVIADAVLFKPIK
jgi:hypothetical protein